MSFWQRLFGGDDRRDTPIGPSNTLAGARKPIILKEYPLGQLLNSTSTYQPVSLATLLQLIPERNENEIAASLVAAHGAKLAIKFYSEDGQPFLKLSGLASDEFGFDAYSSSSVLYEPAKDPCRDLWTAVAQGDKRATKNLLRSTADINGMMIRYQQPYCPPLIQAVWEDRRDLVSLILNAGADVNFCDGLGNSALIVSTANSVELSKFFISAGAIIDDRGQYGSTALMGLRCAEQASLLLKAGADPNVQRDGGSTALFDAVGDGEIEIVRLLLAHGADPNLSLESRYTPLMRAARNRRCELVNMLVEVGADVQAQDDNGTTALAEAAVGGEIEIVRRLIQAGADVNSCAPGNFGRTPLMLASLHEHLDTVRELVTRGADTSACDSEGRTASELAGTSEIKNLLARGGS